MNFISSLLVAILVGLISAFIGIWNYAYFHPEIAFSINDFMNSFDDATEYNTKKNKYLSHNFAPVSEEISNEKIYSLENTQIPSDLAGLFLRIGPNSPPDMKSRRYHVFDGDGMIHAVRIDSNQSYYSNQWINTPRFNLERKFNRSIFLRIGELKGFLGIFKVIFLVPWILSICKLSNLNSTQANTAIAVYNHHIYATHEGGLPFEIQWKRNNTFQSIGYETFHNQLDYPVTAHIKIDPVENLAYFNGYDAFSKFPMKYGAFDSNLNLFHYFPIPLPVLSWTHDLMITENYVMIFESSIHFTTKSILDGLFFDYATTHRLRIGLLPKRSNNSSDILWFVANSSYGIIHPMNGWEEYNDDGEIEVVLWTPLTESFDSTLETANPLHMHEVRMNLNQHSVNSLLRIRKVDSLHKVEFPRVHPKFLGRPTRYGYAGVFHIDDAMDIRGIVRYDTVELTAVTIELGPDERCGEIVPVPKRRLNSELSNTLESHQVYLATFVHSSSSNQSEWRLYDGQTMSQRPVLRLQLPSRVPYGFHGEWIDEDDLQQHFLHTESKIPF